MGSRRLELAAAGSGRGKRGAEAPAGLATTAAPVASVPAGPARAFPPPAPGGGLSWAPGARDHRRPLSLLCLIRPDRGVTCVPGGPPGGGGGRGRGGKRGGKGEGAGGGGRSEGRILRPWEAAAAAAAGSGSRGAGSRRWRRKGPARGWESAARRKPETAGGPVAGPRREPGRRQQRPRRLRRGKRIQRPRRRPGSARSGGRRARAGAMEPQHVRPAPGACSPACEEPVGTAPAPTLFHFSAALPPPGPGSVQEMARDEVPSCFPAGAALPPPLGLLLARRPERLCPASRGSSRGAAG